MRLLRLSLLGPGGDDLNRVYSVGGGDVRRAREAIIASHPQGPSTGGKVLADEVAARLAHAIEGLRDFPRIGHPGAIPGVLEIVVRGPTRRTTLTVGYQLRSDCIIILGITWGGWTFGELRGRGD